MQQSIAKAEERYPDVAVEAFVGTVVCLEVLCENKCVYSDTNKMNVRRIYKYIPSW